MTFTISYNIKAIDQFTEVSKRINSAISEIDKNIKKVNVTNAAFEKRLGRVAKVVNPANVALSKQGDIQSEIFVKTRANSEATEKLNRIKRESAARISDINMKMREHRLATSIANRKIRESNKALADNKRAIADRNKKLRDSIQLQKTFGAGIEKTGNWLNTRVTLPLAAAGGASVKFAMDFNKSMASVATLIPGQTEKVQTYKQEVLDLAVKYGKAQNIVASGLYQVISNVGDTADTMKILDIANKAAVAGVAETADAVNLLTGIASDYGDTSSEMVQNLSDLAFKTVELGSTTFPELANQMGKTTTLAATLGVSTNELFGSFAGLTSGTVRTAQVSTRLAGVMRALLNGAGDLGKTFKKLGVESGDQLVKKYGGLQNALFAMRREVGNNEVAFSKLFADQEAKLAALALTGAKAKEAAREIGLMADVTGASETAFREQSEGINETGFRLEQTKQKVMAMAVTVGDKLLPQVDVLLDKAQPVIDWLKDLDEDSINAALNIGILAAKIGIGAKVLGTLINMKAGIAGLAGQIGGVGAGTGTLSGNIAGTTANAKSLTKQLRTVNGLAAVISSFGAGYAIGEFIHHTWMEPAEQRMEKRNLDIDNIYTVATGPQLAKQTTAELVQMKNAAMAAREALPLTQAGAAFESPSALIQHFVGTFDEDVKRPIDEANQRFTEATKAILKIETEIMMRKKAEEFKAAAVDKYRDDKLEITVKTDTGAPVEIKHTKKGTYSNTKLGGNIK